MNAVPITSFNHGLIRVVVESFGYLHGSAPEADITLDLRDVARDPHISSWMRELTGLEPVVRQHVFDNPEAARVLDATQCLVMAYLPVMDAKGRVVRVAFGCSGGRHRSVVLANALMSRLMSTGVGSDVSHRDILRPVVAR